MRLDQNGDITISKQLTVSENAYITTLQVNQNSYFVGNVFLNNVNINDIYQTRPWISIRVVYTVATQNILVINRGRVSIEPNRSTNTISFDNTNDRWNIIWSDAHPHGDQYIAQYCLYSTIGFIHSGFFDDKTFIMITKNSSGVQAPLSFNITIF